MKEEHKILFVFFDTGNFYADIIIIIAGLAVFYYLHKIRRIDVINTK